MTEFAIGRNFEKPSGRLDCAAQLWFHDNIMTLIQLNYDYDKLKTSMRYWLLGRGFHNAYRAMEFGLHHHTGERKDGMPEFSHQIFQAQFARTLESSLMHPEEVLATIFLHDVVEDCSVASTIIHDEFGEAIARPVWLMTDVDDNGHEKPTAAYFAAMDMCPVASICKGIDRMHNFQSMLEVFDEAKQRGYIQETRTHIITMMKRARKLFPTQEPAYQNIKHVLLTQIELIEKMHKAVSDYERNKPPPPMGTSY